MEHAYHYLNLELTPEAISYINRVRKREGITAGQFIRTLLEAWIKHENETEGSTEEKKDMLQMPLDFVDKLDFSKVKAEHWTWEYRVVATQDENDNWHFAMQRVYFVNDEIDCWDQPEPITGLSKAEIAKRCARMTEGLAKPVIYAHKELVVVDDGSNEEEALGEERKKEMEDEIAKMEKNWE